MDFQVGDFAWGEFLRSWDSATKKKTANNTFTNEQIYWSRHTYLQTIRKLRQDNTHDFNYTDETWVNAHHTNEHIWMDSDGKGGWKVPSGKGQRLIVVHAVGVEGWVEGAGLVFRSQTLSRLPR